MAKRGGGGLLSQIVRFFFLNTGSDRVVRLESVDSPHSLTHSSCRPLEVNWGRPRAKTCEWHGGTQFKIPAVLTVTPSDFGSSAATCETLPWISFSCCFWGPKKMPFFIIIIILYLLILLWTAWGCGWADRATRAGRTGEISFPTHLNVPINCSDLQVVSSLEAGLHSGGWHFDWDF